MTRAKRINEIGYYHVINRGVEKRCVFLDEDDHRTFLALVNKYKYRFQYVIHAHCLMPNHYHLLMEIKEKNISIIMQKLNYKYSIYFNFKYGRVGHLWQGRFKSWYVADERYLNTLTKYIELNPVKAGLTVNVGDYPWSSTSTKVNYITEDELVELQDIT